MSDDKYQTDWTVPEIYRGIRLWPLLPLTAAEIRSLVRFTLQAEMIENPALFPLWLGFAMSKIPGDNHGTFIALQEGCAVFPIKIYSREFLTFVAENLGSIIPETSRHDPAVLLELIREDTTKLVEGRVPQEEEFFDVPKLKELIDGMAWVIL